MEENNDDMLDNLPLNESLDHSADQNIEEPPLRKIKSNALLNLVKKVNGHS